MLDNSRNRLSRSRARNNKVCEQISEEIAKRLEERWDRYTTRSGNATLQDMNQDFLNVDQKIQTLSPSRHHSISGFFLLLFTGEN